MKIKTQLMIGAVFLVALPVIVTSFSIGWRISQSATDILEEKARDQLVSLVKIQKERIEEHFETAANELRAFSEDKNIIEMIAGLSSAVKKIEEKLEPETVASYKKELETYYHEDFLKAYQKRNPGSSLDLKAVLDKVDPLAVALQYHYIAKNPKPSGQKFDLDDAQNDSLYNQYHKQAHAAVRRIIQNLGFYDIFLVDSESGRIVYTVAKEIDFATSLKTGPYAETFLGKVFEKANTSQDLSAITMSDFTASYLPSYGDPAAFIAKPIVKDGIKVGIVILQIPVEPINDIMTHHREWKNVGLGYSGETYLVGDNKRMRSLSRFFIENKDRFFEILKKIDDNAAKIVAAKNTTIDIVQVDTESVKSGFEGKSGFLRFPDYRNIPVLSAYTPVELPGGIRWVAVAEIDEAEAFASVGYLDHVIMNSALVAILVGSVVAVLLGYGFAIVMIQPIYRLVAEIKSINIGGTWDLTKRFPIRGNSEMNALAESLNDFLSQLHRMTREISEYTNHLASSSEELSTVAEQTTQSMRVQQQEIETIHEVVGNILQTGHEMTEHTQQVVAKTDHVNQTTKASNIVVEDTIRTITDLAGEVEEASSAIKRLAENSNSIGSVIDVINGIAEQTNLLALNAAIEAARAGEQGRGFAVVADEVRSLAQRTQKSTHEIRMMIEELQRSSRHTLNIMTHSQGGAEDGVQQIKVMQDSLAQLTESIACITQSNQAVIQSITTQGGLVENVNQRTQKIHEETQQTVNGINQTAKAAEDLAKLATQLQLVVSHFKMV